MAGEIVVARESGVNALNAVRSSSRMVESEERAQIRAMVREAQEEADDILYNTLSEIGRDDLYGKAIELSADYDADEDMTYFYRHERGSGSTPSQRFEIDSNRAALEDAIWEIARRH